MPILWMMKGKKGFCLEKVLGKHTLGVRDPLASTQVCLRPEGKIFTQSMALTMVVKIGMMDWFF